MVQAATDIDDVIGTNQEFFESYKESYQGEIIDGTSIILYCTDSN
jgi:hypothetical protein